jgi:hypothetical protein
VAGRYIVVEFDDSMAADTFTQNQTMGSVMGYKVIGLFIRPEKFCQCPDKQRQNVKNWARGKRTGLWLCKRCKRPSVFHQRGIMDRLLHVFGYNLLPVEWEDE